MASGPVAACMTHLDDWPAVRDTCTTMLPQLRGTDEVVIVDAGSKGPARGFLEKVSRMDPRVRVVTEPGCTRGRGRELAWRSAHADIILHCDADRTWKPDGWQRVVELVPSLREGPLKLRSSLGQIGLGGLLLRREHLERVEGYDASLQYFEDVDLIRRLRLHYALPEVDFPVYARDDKSKMRSVRVNVRYYRDMFRDGARMGLPRDYLASASRGNWRRQVLAATIGWKAYRKGRRMPPALSVQLGAQALA